MKMFLSIHMWGKILSKVNRVQYLATVTRQVYAYYIPWRISFKLVQDLAMCSDPVCTPSSMITFTVFAPFFTPFHAWLAVSVYQNSTPTH
jgi:hypothetical protein